MIQLRIKFEEIESVSIQDEHSGNWKKPIKSAKLIKEILQSELEAIVYLKSGNSFLASEVHIIL